MRCLAFCDNGLSMCDSVGYAWHQLSHVLIIIHVRSTFNLGTLHCEVCT